MQNAHRPTKTALRRLIALAQTQGGYFTAKQAAQIGYKYPHLDYHLRVGNFERAGHGIYRLTDIPLSEQDDLIRLSFWSRNRRDEPQAVASHETALVVHGLSDVLPTKIHLTVPLGFRKVKTLGAVLHRAALDPGDIESREGFSVTTPLRTFLDVAADESLSEEHVERAVAEALHQGLVRRSKLEKYARKHPSNDRLLRALEAVP